MKLEKGKTRNQKSAPRFWVHIEYIVEFGWRKGEKRIRKKLPFLLRKKLSNKVSVKEQR